MLRIMNAKPPTNLEYALLGLLHQMPQSGYDLRKIFATTAMGKIITSLMILTGYAVTAVPTGIVTSEMVASRKDETTDACPSCGVHGHLLDANYCRKCGEHLN